MFNLIAKYWWTFVVRGLLAMAFGLIALVWPGITLMVLVALFGIYVIIEGVLSVIAAFNNRWVKSWWVLLLEGLAGIVIGCVAFLWPGLTAVILLVFIAIWSILTGLLEIGAAIQLRKEIRGEWILALTGVLSILIGLILVMNPGAGALAVVWLIGVYALLFGGLLTYLGLKFRKLQAGASAGRERPV